MKYTTHSLVCFRASAMKVYHALSALLSCQRVYHVSSVPSPSAPHNRFLSGIQFTSPSVVSQHGVHHTFFFLADDRPHIFHTFSTSQAYSTTLSLPFHYTFSTFPSIQYNTFFTFPSIQCNSFSPFPSIQCNIFSIFLPYSTPHTPYLVSV